MKHTAKWLLALVLVLSLALAGCGGNTAGTVTPAATTAPAETTAPTETEPPLSLGRMEGGVYTNSYAGFGCTLDESWTFYGAEELQEMPDNVRELLKDTELSDLMENADQVTDMMAENVDLMSSMNVLYQKMDMASRLLYAAMSEEEIVNALLDQQDTMTAAYAQMGMEITAMEKTSVSFLGEERIGLRTEGTMQGAPVYMIQLFDYTRGSYSVTTTLTSYYEDNTGTMLALFYAVD